VYRFVLFGGCGCSMGLPTLLQPRGQGCNVEKLFARMRDVTLSKNHTFGEMGNFLAIKGILL
jgi:hypothetical protein